MLGDARHVSRHENSNSRTRQSHDAEHANSSAELRHLRNPHRAQVNEQDAESTASTLSDEEDVEASPSPTLHKPKRVATFSKAYTPAEEAAVLRKLDRRLVLFLALLYLLSFLDRSNIGNARIAGLETSLSLSSGQFDWLLTAFYITYIAFEWMILLYKMLPPHAYIACCVAGWGVVASLQSLTTSFPQLLLLRGLLGITEAAFGPGVPFFMTFFFRRRELAYRVGLQISAAPLATSFASSLAWLIIWLNRKLGEPVESWRMLFLVEGFPSVLVGVLAWYWIPDSPGTIRWLTPRERKVASLRMQDESDQHTQPHALPNTTSATSAATAGARSLLTEILFTLSDPKPYLHAFLFFSVNVSFASLPVFLPTIINSLSFSPLASQALAAPPYLFAFAFVLLVGRWSDRIPDSRGWFLMGTASLSSAAYAVVGLVGWGVRRGVVDKGGVLGVWVRYAAMYPAAMGMFSSVTLIITWTLNNQESRTGKGVAMTVLNVVGQCGPLVGVRLFPTRQGPEFVGGMLASAAFMGAVAGGAGGLRWYLRGLNLRSGAAKGDEVEMEVRERLIGEGEDGGGDGDEDGGRPDGGERTKQRSERFRFML
jgi:phosphatidylinositol 3,5-bisphosphate 5-phosphatase